MTEKSLTFAVAPVSKPRMTQSDKWNKRPCTSRYWAYKDVLRLIAKRNNFVMPESGYHLVFYIPMPKSWAKIKKAQMSEMPHQQKPDIDNLHKAFLDALLADDSKVWDGQVTKYWSHFGRVSITWKEN